VTGLVVELGESPEGATLRAKLARAVGDRALVIGYRVPGSDRFVDDEGRPVVLPAPGSGRAVTPLVDRDDPIAVLVHDEAVLADGGLVDSVAAAARIAVANAALQAEAQAKALELETSRRRLLEAADAERRRVQRELQLGPGRRLGTVAALLAKARVPAVEDELADARRELDELARGLDPTALSEGGLVPALVQLADRSPIPVEVHGSVGRLPAPVEAALFFVCSEALANAAKHAQGSHVSMSIGTDDDSVVVEVVDDGVGGAAAGRGTGLTGLADRIATLGGTFSVDSPRGSGTTVVARLPRSTARA
jgi:signal transduction histidine kinase